MLSIFRKVQIALINNVYLDKASNVIQKQETFLPQVDCLL